MREEGCTYREIAKTLKVSFRDISRVLKDTKGEEKLEKQVKALERKIDELEKRIKLLSLRLGRIVDVLGPTLAVNKLAVYCPNCMSQTLIVEDPKILGYGFANPVENLYLCSGMLWLENSSSIESPRYYCIPSTSLK